MYPNTDTTIEEADLKACTSATAGMPDPWHGLLQPMHKSFRELDGGVDGGTEVSETEGILFALAQAVEQRDSVTAAHCERLAFISVALGMALGLDRDSLLALYRGGYLHDIGKVGIPDSILFKPGKLTPQEWVVMRSHTTRGAEICRHLKRDRKSTRLNSSHLG